MFVSRISWRHMGAQTHFGHTSDAQTGHFGHFCHFGFRQTGSKRPVTVGRRKPERRRRKLGCRLHLHEIDQLHHLDQLINLIIQRLDVVQHLTDFSFCRELINLIIQRLDVFQHLTDFNFCREPILLFVHETMKITFFIKAFVCLWGLLWCPGEPCGQGHTLFFVKLSPDLVLLDIRRSTFQHLTVD